MSDERLLLSLGELRAEHLRLFSPDRAQDILLAAPGHLGSFRGVDRIHASPVARIPVAVSGQFREALARTFVAQLDGLPQSTDWVRAILAWADALEGGKARCFLQPDVPVFTRMVSFPGRSTLGAAPITPESTDGRGEPLVELVGEAHARARAWLSGQLESAEDVSTEVAGWLRGCWAGAPLSPAELYYKVLSEYFAGTVAGDTKLVGLNPVLDQLTDFQLEAYQYALGILRRYGGVFLADVVGLGKTYIALAILRYYQDHLGEHAVVVAPPNVIPNWKRTAAELRVEIQCVSIGKLDDLDALEDRELLVIDESHHFRNKTTERYERIQQWLRPGGEPSRRKVLLLSATPQNNGALDVKHQLQLFPDNYKRLPFTGESMDAWFKEVLAGKARLADLLQHVVVRRTRRFVQAAYPNAQVRERGPDGRYHFTPLRFPVRLCGPGQCLRYAINDSYPGGLYDDTLGTLRRLKLAPYQLASYLTPEGMRSEETANIRRAGAAPRGLIRMLLLKRVESSVAAFRATLETLCARYRTCLDELAVRKVTLKVGAAGASDDAGIDEGTEGGSRQVSSSLFVVAELRRNLEEDLSAIEGLLDRVGKLHEEQDAKVDRLKRYLEGRFAAGGKRAIVFTQFADTAEYLGRRLGQSLGRTEVASSSHGNPLELVRRFAPVANRATVAAEDQVDLLVSTDMLGEGVNLQDADTLVNYDLHWNPVRLIQRAGRIDRIGSPHEVIEIASFLPEAKLEEQLGLEEVLRRRISEFLAVFGEDSAVLPSDEVLSEEAALQAYSGVALDETADAMDGLSRHVERLLHWKAQNPDGYLAVQSLRPGRHALSKGRLHAVSACRMGWYWRFYRPASGRGDLLELDDLEALDALWSHAEAGSAGVSAASREDAFAFVNASRAKFSNAAALLREQRTRSRLSGVEEFVRRQLEAFKSRCDERNRARVEAVDAWVRGGHAQLQLRRAARTWQREKWSSEEVFLETRALMDKFPAIEESLGEPEVIGASWPGTADDR